MFNCARGSRGGATPRTCPQCVSAWRMMRSLMVRQFVYALVVLHFNWYSPSLIRIWNDDGLRGTWCDETVEWRLDAIGTEDGAYYNVSDISWCKNPWFRQRVKPSLPSRPTSLMDNRTCPVDGSSGSWVLGDDRLMLFFEIFDRLRLEYASLIAYVLPESELWKQCVRVLDTLLSALGTTWCWQAFRQWFRNSTRQPMRHPLREDVLRAFVLDVEIVREYDLRQCEWIAFAQSQTLSIHWVRTAAALVGVLPLLSFNKMIGYIAADSVWFDLALGAMWFVLGLASLRVAALDTITVLGKDKRLLTYARLTACKSAHPNFFLQTRARIPCVAQVDMVSNVRFKKCRVRLRAVAPPHAMLCCWSRQTSWCSPFLVTVDEGQTICRYAQQILGQIPRDVVIEPVVATCGALRRPVTPSLMRMLWNFCMLQKNGT